MVLPCSTRSIAKMFEPLIFWTGTGNAKMKKNAGFLDVADQGICFLPSWLPCGDIYCLSCEYDVVPEKNPSMFHNRHIGLRTAVSFWGQPTQISSSLSPKRDCGPQRVKASFPSFMFGLLWTKIDYFRTHFCVMICGRCGTNFGLFVLHGNTKKSAAWILSFFWGGGGGGAVKGKFAENTQNMV